jgi:hypothetical protein
VEKRKPAWTRIQAGDYSPDDLACMLLRAMHGNYQDAKKVLTKASNKPRATLPPIASGIANTSDDMIYCAAYHLIQKKERCSDNTALKKLLGPGKYRTLYNRLVKRKQTLKQIARQYPIGVKAKQEI